MGSEAIVVLTLIALAIVFIIWVRKNSRDYDSPGQAGKPGDEGERASDRK